MVFVSRASSFMTFAVGVTLAPLLVLLAALFVPLGLIRTARLPLLRVVFSDTYVAKKLAKNSKFLEIWIAKIASFLPKTF